MILNKEEKEEDEAFTIDFQVVISKAGHYFMEAKRHERTRKVLYKRFVEFETDGIQYSEAEFSNLETANLLLDILLRYSSKLKG